MNTFLRQSLEYISRYFLILYILGIIFYIVFEIMIIYEKEYGICLMKEIKNE